MKEYLFRLFTKGNCDFPIFNEIFTGEVTYYLYKDFLPKNENVISSTININNTEIQSKFTFAFSELYLDIDRVAGVTESLIEFWKKDIRNFFDEQNQINSDDYKGSTGCRGTYRFTKMPQLLALNLNRMSEDEYGDISWNCSSFEIPNILNFTESRYDDIFDPECITKKKLLVGILVCTYCTHSNRPYIETRIRQPGSKDWIVIERSSQINKLELCRILSHDEALQVNGGKVGDDMALQLVYLDYNTFTTMWRETIKLSINLNYPCKKSQIVDVKSLSTTNTSKIPGEGSNLEPGKKNLRHLQELMFKPPCKFYRYEDNPPEWLRN